MHLRYGAKTHPGRRRRENEDSFDVDFESSAYPAQPGLFVVCDGVGGAKAGKTASSLGVREMRAAFRNAKHGDLTQRLVEAAQQASAAIFERAQHDVETSGMATTLVAAAFDGERCYIANVGDSRAYRLASGEITQVTTDHTLIQEQLESGMITEDQAAISPYRHMITRSLGMEPADFGVEAYPAIPLVDGDVYLLCSDGLTDMVDEDEMLRLGSSGDPQRAAEALVDLANQHGGRDNVTVLIVRVAEAD
jgi:serine/threonine protein phosphatase PrpC